MIAKHVGPDDIQETPLWSFDQVNNPLLSVSLVRAFSALLVVSLVIGLQGGVLLKHQFCRAPNLKPQKCILPMQLESSRDFKRPVRGVVSIAHLLDALVD